MATPIPMMIITLYLFNVLNTCKVASFIFLLSQVIPFKSPLTKGDLGGCVYSRLFYNPLAPFSKGDSLCIMINIVASMLHFWNTYRQKNRYRKYCFSAN